MRSRPLSGKTLRFRAACFGPLDPCAEAAAADLAAVAQAAHAAERHRVEHARALARRTLDGSNAIGAMLRLGTLEVGASWDSTWAWLQPLLALTLRVEAGSMLPLFSGATNNTRASPVAVEFVIRHDSQSDRSARHIFTELQKRVALAARSTMAGLEGGGQAVFPLPDLWHVDENALEGVSGAGTRCSHALADVSNDQYHIAKELGSQPCSGFGAMGMQYVAIIYQVLVAIVLTLALTLHLVQLVCRWGLRTTAVKIVQDG